MLFGKLIWYQSRYIGIYFVLIRPPSCMAVSRSYPWHLMKWIITSLFSYLRVFLKRCNFILLTSLFFILKRPSFFSLESFLLHLGIPGGLVICAVISSIIPPTIVQLCVRLSGPSPFDCLFHQVIRWQSSVRIYLDILSVAPLFKNFPHSSQGYRW